MTGRTGNIYSNTNIEGSPIPGFSPDACARGNRQELPVGLSGFLSSSISHMPHRISVSLFYYLFSHIINMAVKEEVTFSIQVFVGSSQYNMLFTKSHQLFLTPLTDLDEICFRH
jgi:hypothetical protein